MSKTKKSSSSLGSKAKKFSRAGLAVLSSIPTPGWGSASKKALAVSVSRSKVKKTSTKNKNQTNKKTSKKLSSLKKLLKRLSQKSRYGRMYTNARKLSSERDKLNKQEKLKLAMLIAVDAFSSGSGGSVQKRPTNEDEMLKAVYKYAYEYYRNNHELSHLIINSSDLDNSTAHAYPLPYNRSRSDSNQAIKKIFNSIGEIFVDILDADKMRREKIYDSVYDHFNWASRGVLEGAILAIDGQVERLKKMFDSPYDFGNAMSLGAFDIADGAVNPKDPLSKEHLLNIMGLAGTVAGGGAAVQVLKGGIKGKGTPTSGTGSSATKEKNSENTQGTSGKESGTEGTEQVTKSVNTSIETFTRDEARQAAQNLLHNGEISLSNLESMIPPGVQNTFVKTSTITDGAKYEFLLADGQKAIIRWHSPDPVAASKYPGAASGNRWTAQIKIGNKQLKSDGTWTKNQSLNEVHVPIEGK